MTDYIKTGGDVMIATDMIPEAGGIELHYTLAHAGPKLQAQLDRIEAQGNHWQRKRVQDVIKLGAMVGRLEEALRKIVASEDDPLDYETVVAIARAALPKET